MSIDLINHDHKNDNLGSKGCVRSFVWEYFEKIIGDDGLQKARCTKCNKVYNTLYTSTLRRHWHKCIPQPLTQLSSELASSWINTSRSDNKLTNEARHVKKKLKSVKNFNLRSRTDRELPEFIGRNKRHVGFLEEKLPDKAKTLKEGLKACESELNCRAKLQLPKENIPGAGSIVEVKMEVDDQLIDLYENFGQNMAEDRGAVEDGTTETNAIKTSPQCTGSPQIVSMHEDQYQEYAQHKTIPILSRDKCAELKEVSSVLSMLTSPNSDHTPPDKPLDEEAKQAKQALGELLEKDFKTIVDSAEAEKVKSCVQILTKNLDKLPRFQGRVIESLNSEFETACQNWITCHTNIQSNIAFEAEQGDNIKVLKEWQEKDMELESKIAKVDADILCLRAELLEKELTRENMIKEKCDLFDQSKISIDEAKELLHKMLMTKLRSDVMIENMKDLTTKWERMKENFKVK